MPYLGPSFSPSLSLGPSPVDYNRGPARADPRFPLFFSISHPTSERWISHVSSVTACIAGPALSLVSGKKKKKRGEIRVPLTVRLQRFSRGYYTATAVCTRERGDSRVHVLLWRWKCSCARDGRAAGGRHRVRRAWVISRTEERVFT